MTSSSFPSSTTEPVSWVNEDIFRLEVLETDPTIGVQFEITAWSFFNAYSVANSSSVVREGLGVVDELGTAFSIFNPLESKLAVSFGVDARPNTDS